MIEIPRSSARLRSPAWFYLGRGLMWLYGVAWAALFLIILFSGLSWWLKALAIGALVPGWPQGRDFVLSHRRYLEEADEEGRAGNSRGAGSR